MEHLTENLIWLLIAASVGSGMMAGLFIAFSTFMMKALSSLPNSEGIRAMQAINRFIQRPSFFIVFMGTGLLCLFIIWLSYDDSEIAYITLSASFFYLMACIASTIAFNVPLNNQLDTVNADSKQGHDFWHKYLSVWTKWNHLRSIATLATSILFALAISRLS